MHLRHNKYIDIDVLAEEALVNPSALTQKIPQLIEELADAIDCIKKVAPEHYFEHYLGLHKIVHGYFMTESLYEYATSMMDNVDGSHGAKLSTDKISEEAKKHGLVPTALYGRFCIAYIFSMYCSDNWDKALSDEENIAFAMKATKGFLTDPDAPQTPGRALRFFTKVALWKPGKHK